MTIWDLNKLFEAPAHEETKSFKHPGLRAVFYEGLPHNGGPTKIFAWLGLPKVKKGKKIPAMVLVHGGGGTAFLNWVKLWNSRGYAAIAMDTCGGVPDKQNTHDTNWTRHKHSGPAGWGNFDMASEPPHEQWPCHAVAAVILGHSLLRSFDEVDSSKIGITGVSWGGVLTCITSGLDDRLAFAAPVYGCGFLNGDCVWNDGKSKSYQAWLRLWDPSTYLKWAKMPFLWLNGTNDVHFPIDSTMKSSALTKGERRLSLRVRMHHSHGPVSEAPPEILDFAEAVNGKRELPPALTTPSVKKGVLSAAFDGSRKILRAELNHTRASGFWTDRFWNTVPANVDMRKRIVSAELPRAATACFLNVHDANGLVYSSPMKEI